MEMKEKDLAERVAVEQRKQGGPAPPRKKAGGWAGMIVAGMIVLLAFFAFFSGKGTVGAEAKFDATGGRVFVAVTDANGTREYQAPCVFPAVKNGTLIIYTPDPEAHYTGEARVGRHKVQGVVYRERVNVYHTDEKGDITGGVVHE